MKKKKSLIAILYFIITAMSYQIPQQIAVAATSATEAKAECVIELNSRRILYESNGDVRLPMASTTKIATAATILEKTKNLDERFSIPKEAVGIEGSSVYLQEGDVYSVNDLLYGLMLRSGNDCATALAIKCSKTVEAFCSEMNMTAQQAGALNTNFKNPHGLPENGHYTTARDLSMITAYAMKIPKFAEIVSTEYYAPCGWKNKNKMLYLYEGGIGVKTGYTKEAGRCLVSAANKYGMTLICTVLNCPMTYERSIQLLEDAYEAYKLKNILQKGDVFELSNGKSVIKAVAREEFSYPLSDGEETQLEFCISNVKNRLFIAKNDKIVGQIEIYLAKRLLFSTNLYKL